MLDGGLFLYVLILYYALSEELTREAIQMTRRVLALFVALIMCVGFMSFAYAEEDKPYAGTKITFASFQTGDVEKDWIEVQFKKFQEETGIEVEHVYIEHADTISTLMTWMAGDMAPDACMISAAYENSLAAKGLLLDIGGYIAEKKPEYDITRFFPNLLEAYQYEGVQYALPSDLDLAVTWYNKDMFDAAGVAYPAPGWTWEDYRAAAAALTSGAGPEKIYGSERPPIQMTLWQAGADYLSADGKTCTINTPEAKKAYEFILGMINDGIVPAPGSAGVGFDSGRCAMAPNNGAWYAHYVLSSVDFNWDIAPLPVGDYAATAAYGSTCAVLKNSKNIDAAVEFITWFLSDEQQFIRAKQFAWCPPAQTVLEFPGFEDESVLCLTQAQKEMMLAENVNGRAPVVVSNQNEITQIINREESLIWSGEKSIDDALATMEAEITPLL